MYNWPYNPIKMAVVEFNSLARFWGIHVRGECSRVVRGGGRFERVLLWHNCSHSLMLDSNRFGNRIHKLRKLPYNPLKMAVLGFNSLARFAGFLSRGEWEAVNGSSAATRQNGPIGDQEKGKNIPVCYNVDHQYCEEQLYMSANSEVVDKDVRFLKRIHHIVWPF